VLVCDSLGESDRKGKSGGRSKAKAKPMKAKQKDIGEPETRRGKINIAKKHRKGKKREP
jgi:hypothetical protein